MSDTKRILGIDPGLNVTGYGVLDIAGNSFNLVEAGVVRSKRGGELPVVQARIRHVVARVG